MKREDVLNYLTKIPKGMVSTYKDIANYYNSKAYRQVGMMLHSNDDKYKYPCYKIVNSKGYPSSNYKFGGIEEQIRLLKEDNIELINGNVDLERHEFSLILKTPRLYLRKLVKNDLPRLEEIMNDKVMTHYERHFGSNEVYEWYLKQRERYKTNTGLLACCLKENNKLIGQVGLTYQEIPEKTVLEVGYIFDDKYWHNGYASEASKALINLAFNKGYNEVYSIIKWNNIPSQKVALRNNMHKVLEYDKIYYNKVMKHFVYRVCKDEIQGK